MKRSLQLITLASLVFVGCQKKTGGAWDDDNTTGRYMYKNVRSVWGTDNDGQLAQNMEDFSGPEEDSFIGADYVIDVQKEDPLQRIMEITGGKGVDVSLDCTAGAGTIPILLGIEALKRKGGTIVVQGELAQFPNFPLEKFTVKFISMHSARGHSYKACELALAQIASNRFPLEKITTHRFGLKDVDLAIRSVGSLPGGKPDVIHASLLPWA